MTKLESADVLIYQDGNCESPISIYCDKCCCADDSGYNNCMGKVGDKACLAIAIKYKKDHKNDGAVKE